MILSKSAIGKVTKSTNLLRLIKSETVLLHDIERFTDDLKIRKIQHAEKILIHVL